MNVIMSIHKFHFMYEINTHVYLEIYETSYGNIYKNIWAIATFQLATFWNSYKRLALYLSNILFYLCIFYRSIQYLYKAYWNAVAK